MYVADYLKSDPRVRGNYIEEQLDHSLFRHLPVPSRRRTGEHVFGTFKRAAHALFQGVDGQRTLRRGSQLAVERYKFCDLNY